MRQQTSNNIKNKIKRGRTIAFLLLALSIFGMAEAGYHLQEIRQTYLAGNAGYDALTDRVRSDGATASQLSAADAASSALPHPAEAVAAPDMAPDFAALKEINPDVAAWLYGPDTPIDYPVVWASDYDYYLHHLPDGTPNAYGTLFIDYNNAADFSDELTIIYGHNMKSGRMFGSLGGYKTQTYYDANPYLYIYTAQGEAYRLDLLYGCIIGAGQWRERAFMYKENRAALLAYAEKNTTFVSPASYTDDDRFVVLSTCSYEFDDARYVVIGVLRPAFVGEMS